MDVRVNIDERALRVETDRQAKNLVFTTSQAINKTLLDSQLDERANIDQKLTIRKPSFMYRLVKIFQFSKARAGVLYGEIGIDNSKARVLLSKLEEGGEKDPIVGKNVAVPITGTVARPSFSQSVPTRFMFKSLAMQRHVTAGGKVQWKGRNRTFVIPGVGIAMRSADGKKTDRTVTAQAGFKGLEETTGTKLIYVFLKHPRLKAGLTFVARARRLMNQVFPEHFNRIFNAKR